MRRARSIKARLFFVFSFLFFLVIVLGLQSLRSLSRVNDASAQIRDRWLPSTHALGDLNNFTTDFPAAESALNRAVGISERSAVLRQMAVLDRSIASAQRDYRLIAHDSRDDGLYGQFELQWARYRAAEPASEASKSAYADASRTLDELTARNVQHAREASEGSDTVYHESRRRIAITILLAGLLVAGAMLYVTRSISAPLVDLAARMHRLAANETRLEVLGADRHDEIGGMARAVLVFRNNAVDLAHNRQALAEQADRLRRKLADEKRLTLLQRNFVSMASHEFRTPLAIIDGHAQRLISMSGRLTREELAERASKVRAVVRRMTQLIDNLIGSARLIDGPVHLFYQPAEVDLTPILRETCRAQRDLTPEAHIVEEAAAGPLLVHGDAGLLSQVIANLLSNAVKYSPAGEAIFLTAACEQEQAAVSVEDSGIGIAEEDRDRIFEPYFRGSNTAGVVGSGVGLYLVRTIADLHHGSISFETRENGGSRFTFRLPISATSRLANTV